MFKSWGYGLNTFNLVLNESDIYIYLFLNWILFLWVLKKVTVLRGQAWLFFYEFLMIWNLKADIFLKLHGQNVYIYIKRVKL